MRRLVLGLLCVVLMTARNVILQTADHGVFTEVFKTYAKSSEFGGRLFAELLMMAQKGATLQNLNDHVEELRNYLSDDQAEDEKYLMINNKNRNLELRLSVESINARIKVLNQQQQIIEGLFENDQFAYQKRLGDQNVILELIDQLIQRLNAMSQDGHSLIEKDNLLDEIKALGRGKHVEVLAQITSHLGNEYIGRIMELLSKLRDAVLNSLEADEVKEQENIRLYNKLSGEIRNSFAESTRQYQELDAHYQSQEYELNVKMEGVKDVGQKLQDRNDDRQFILDRVQEAQKLLNDNLDRIVRWSIKSE
ncbi:unnamed protein product [Paramecium pentaurelia]|uniref:Uncharacterized protein n=1 Tax=Paramecium pentaurelia TaxID=43138 RepID=A0A8S1YFR3_9CILI|nr:unnamed protein product [Paramecium pentaurelia]